MDNAEQNSKLYRLYIRELELQKEKWFSYLNALRTACSSISAADDEKLLLQASYANEILKEIKESEKVSLSFSHFEEMKNAEVFELQREISAMRKECLSSLAQNTSLIKAAMEKLKEQIDRFNNPLRSASSVYSDSDERGEMVEFEA